jgi:hypothetical protein
MLHLSIQNMKKFNVFILVSFFSVSMVTAQEKKTKSEQAVDQLYRTLSKNLRYPERLYESKTTCIFSVMFIFSSDNKVENTIASKYTPQELQSRLMDRNLYKDVDWQSIFGRKIKHGDYLILPISLYLESDKSTTIIDYTIDDIVNREC